MPSIPSPNARHTLPPACPCYGQEHYQSSPNTPNMPQIPHCNPTDSTLYCPLRLHQLHRIPTVHQYKDACVFFVPLTPAIPPASQDHQQPPPPPATTTTTTNKSQLTSNYTPYSTLLYYGVQSLLNNQRSLQQHTHESDI